MISKFVNLGWVRDGESANLSIDDQYLNRVNDLADVTPYNPSDAFSTDFLANYPKTNLQDYAIYKEARLNTFQNGPTYFAGISCALTSGFGDWNTIAIQFNKFNSDLVTKLRTLNIIIEWERIDTPGLIDYSITLNSSTLIESGTDTITSGKIYPREGLILIDNDITRNMAEQSFQESEYQINIYFTSSSDFEYFSISNLTFTNSVDIYLDDKVDFERENLDKLTMNKRTGSLFRQINSEVKALKSKISLLDKSEITDFHKNVVRFNKSQPFFFFPYCNSEETASFEYSLLNLEQGGLYTFDKKWKTINDSFDIFDVNIKLKEHK